MLFNEIIVTSQAVSNNSSRQQKTRLLAECLRSLSSQEIPIATNYLSGAIRQGRIGIGVAKLFRTHHQAAALPSLTITDVDAVFEELAATTGSGSSTRRAALLKELFARATPAEQGFLARLIVGELRQGALEGVMVEAVALAAELPVEKVQRALMLTGSLPEVAVTALSKGVPGLEEFTVQLFKPVAPMLGPTGARPLRRAAAAGSGLPGVETRRGEDPAAQEGGRGAGIQPQPQ